MRLAISLICVVCACGPSVRNNTGDDDDDDVDASTSGPTADAKRCEKMDVLFVIDNSGSMGQEQTNLIANFPAFITVLNNSGMDYRVAVTTTGRNYSYTMTTPIGNLPQSQDGGDNGAMLKPGACNMTKRWIDK